ncbi:MAG: phosphonate ABC transporter, permease protein PhnE [Alphaproteobacteria bacterium]|nr:phosphonate ABC transporter, permease protein PhnE [Alphaproteobacteria bacterium]
MRTGLLALPEQHLGQLLAHYRREVSRRRVRALAMLVGLFLLVAFAGRWGEVDLGRLLHHLSGLTSYFGRIMPTLRADHLTGDIADWYWNFLGWLKLLFDTVLIAYLATFGGMACAGILACLGAANLAPNGAVRWVVKRLFEFCRTVPDLVFALLFVSAFGLGPLAGVLAIGIHSFGTLGKLYIEAIENIDMNPVEGVRSAGGRFVDVVRFAALPQVFPNLASYTLLRFEINVRASSIVGFVGAGGIGQDLFVAIRKFYYTDVSAILLMIIVTVSIIDVLTERIRHRLGPAGSIE